MPRTSGHHHHHRRRRRRRGVVVSGQLDDVSTLLRPDDRRVRRTVVSQSAVSR